VVNSRESNITHLSPITCALHSNSRTSLPGSFAMTWRHLPKTLAYHHRQIPHPGITNCGPGPATLLVFPIGKAQPSLCGCR